MQIFDQNSFGFLAIPPSLTIARELEALELSHQQAAKKLGLTISQLEQLLCGELSVNNKIARKLEAIGAGTAKFWLKKQEQYNQHPKRGGARANSGPKPSGLTSKQVRISALPAEMQVITTWLEQQPNASRAIAKLIQKEAIQKTG